MLLPAVWLAEYVPKLRGFLAAGGGLWRYVPAMW